jgi:predicted transcriptional regulator
MPKVHSLSIHPPYVKEIQLGLKVYELRKYNPRIHRGSWVAVYETKPTMAITTLFSAGNTLVEDPQWFWDHNKNALGINEDDYFSYFKGKTTVFALEIIKVRILPNPIGLAELKSRYKIHPPQGSITLKGNIPSRILDLIN